MQTSPSLRAYQEAGVEELLKKLHTMHGALLADAPGLGKALANGTGVATPSGFTPIEQLKPGDLVYGTDGKPYHVTGVFPQGIKQCMRVWFSDGYFIECSEDHLWAVWTHTNWHRGKEPQVLRTRDMVGREYRRYRVPVSMPVRYPDYGKRVISAYNMGALIANGCLSWRRVLFTSSDSETIERFGSELPEGMHMRHRGRYDYDVCWSSLKNIPHPYRVELDRLALHCKSVSKFIPPEYLYASDRLELLRGLMDCDGCCLSDGTLQYYTSSLQLAQDVRTLAESLGCVVRVSVKKAGYKGKTGKYIPCEDAISLTLNPPVGLVPFHLPRKIARMKKDRKYFPARIIRSITAITPRQCTCIAVDSPDHLFLTEHFIPTHNTAQAIEVANRLASEDGAPRPFTVLVVAPASLRINWSREIRTWAWTNAGYEVLTYGEVVRGKQSRPRYSLIIFDESHYLKNPDAKRTKAGLALDADYRLFLTGTPCVNRPMEMFPMLKSLGLKMSRTDYGVRYCGGKLITVPIRGGHGKRRAWDFTGSSNTEELNKVLRKSVMVRRTKEEVLKELPRKVRQVISMDFKSGESREFRERFASLSLAADILRTAGKIPFNELARERYNVAMAKLPYVLDFLNDLLEEEEKVAVFAHHRDVIDAIVKAGENRVAFVGGMTEKQKDAAVQAFQNGPARVFVGQIVAAGTGLTLTAARTVLFAELDWVPGNVTQAEDRCHRIGQKDTVRVFHLVAEGSIDARIVRAIVDKQQIIKEITK